MSGTNDAFNSSICSMEVNVLVKSLHRIFIVGQHIREKNLSSTYIFFLKLQFLLLKKLDYQRWVISSCKKLILWKSVKFEITKIFTFHDYRPLPQTMEADIIIVLLEGCRRRASHLFDWTLRGPGDNWTEEQNLPLCSKNAAQSYLHQASMQTNIIFLLGFYKEVFKIYDRKLKHQLVIIYEHPLLV